MLDFEMNHLILEQIDRMVRDDFKCSQIMAALGLKNQGRRSPDLIRAMHGLSAGLGYNGKLCGVLTGGAALIAFYAGRGEKGEKEHPKLWSMIEEYVEWFEMFIGEKKGIIDCDKILERAGHQTSTKEICASIIARGYREAISILSNYGLIQTHTS